LSRKVSQLTILLRYEVVEALVWRMLRRDVLWTEHTLTCQEGLGDLTGFIKCEFALHIYRDIDAPPLREQIACKNSSSLKIKISNSKFKVSIGLVRTIVLLLMHRSRKDSRINHNIIIRRIL
jgi:hypothetical protein